MRTALYTLLALAGLYLAYLAAATLLILGTERAAAAWNDWLADAIAEWDRRAVTAAHHDWIRRQEDT